MMSLKIKNIITQILFMGNLIKFFWIIVITLQVRQEMFALGLTYRKCPRSRIIGPV